MNQSASVYISVPGDVPALAAQHRCPPQRPQLNQHHREQLAREVAPWFQRGCSAKRLIRAVVDAIERDDG